MFDVLIYLFKHYSIDVNSFQPGQEKLAEELLGAGFLGDEVSKAFTWLDELFSTSEQGHYLSSWQSSPSHTLRTFSHHESSRLTLEVQVLLSRLVHVGLLDEYSRELVIDRIMALESKKVSIEYVNYIILMTLSTFSEFSDLDDWVNSVVSEKKLGIIH